MNTIAKPNQIQSTTTAIFVALTIIFGTEQVFSQTLSCSKLFETDLDQVTNTNYSQYENLLKLINPEVTDGLGMKALGLKKSTTSHHAVIDVQVYHHIVSWDRPDLAGDSRWATSLLKRQAEYFGFSLQIKGEAPAVTIPTVEKANWAITNYNSAKPKKERIPFRLDTDNGIVSHKQYLEKISQGSMPVALDAGRTFIHDIQYHLVSILITKPVVFNRMILRAQTMLRLIQTAKQKHSDDKLLNDLLDDASFYVTGAFDQTGNLVPMLHEYKANSNEFHIYANAVNKAIGYKTDLDFFNAIINKVVNSSPKYSSQYIDRNLLTKESFEAATKDYDYDMDRQLFPAQLYVEKKLKDFFLTELGQTKASTEDREFSKAMSTLEKLSKRQDLDQNEISNLFQIFD